jgi:hypothetical protein
MLARLADPELYRSAFNSVHEKTRERGSEEPILAEAPPLSGVVHELDELCNRLATLVPTGQYELSPVEPRQALIGGKWRDLFRSPPLDVIVLTALAHALGEALEPTFSSCLHSYRRGHSTQQVLSATSRYIREQRSKTGAKGFALHVIRRDVKSYGDSIPSGPESPLWTMLAQRLSARGVRLPAPLWSWLVRAIRPTVQAADGSLHTPAVGIPTGSPLQPLMCNVYLGELDVSGAAHDQGFYVRFGDDLLFLHPDASCALHMAEAIDAKVSALGLSLNTAKNLDLYLTAAGRSPTRALGFVPQTSFKYLGQRIDARGELGLSHDKARALLRALHERLTHSARLCSECDFAVQARVLCQVANATLDARHETAHPVAQLLDHAVFDRGQLDDLDHQIALRIAEALTGVHGPRAFRKAPRRVLRERFGLTSLVAARDRKTRSQRHA